MNLRFTLNDVFILENMPDGWLDLALKIKRDSKSNAIYIDYTSDLTFWGDGWSVCKYFIDGVGICARIPVLIEIDENDTGDYEYLYDGVVNLKDCDIDYERLTVKGPIKSDSYLEYVNEMYDKGVWYFNHIREQGRQTTFNGSEIDTTALAKYASIHSIISGNYDLGEAYLYKVSEALTYHFQYMTGNKVTVVSDFFTKTSFDQGIYKIHITGFVDIGDVFEIQFTDCFGRVIIKTVTTNRATLSQRYEDIAHGLLQHGDFGRYFGSLDNGSKIAATAYAFFDGSMFSFAEGESADNDIFAYFVTPITDFTVTSPDHTVTVELIQPLQYGMKNLFLSFNSELALSINNNIMGNKLVTFENLFAYLDSHFNLAMSLEKVGDVFQMRIEPKEYFYNTPQIIDIGDVINITASPNTDLLIQNLAVGTKGANGNCVRGASGKKQIWSVKSCSADLMDKNTESNFDITSIGWQYPDFEGNYALAYPNDIAFVLSTQETTDEGNSSGSPVLSLKHRIRIVDSNVPQVNTLDFWAFNHGLINYWAVKNHLFSFAGSPQSPSTNPDITEDYVVKNSDSAFSRKNYECEALLTREQVRRCIIQPTGRIGFVDNQGEQKSCSLFEMEWNVNTQRAKLKLFG